MGYFWINFLFYHATVCCVHASESPHQGDITMHASESLHQGDINIYDQDIIVLWKIEKKNPLNYPHWFLTWRYDYISSSVARTTNILNKHMVCSTRRFVVCLSMCHFVLLFLVLLVLRSPRLGKRELILVLFVRLFDLCLFGFVGFLFLLGSGKGCGLWLWHSLHFSLTFL